MNSVLKTEWWIIIGGILQGLIQRPVFFIVFINNLSDGMGWDEPLSRFRMTPKWGWGRGLWRWKLPVEAGSRAAS